MDKSFVTIEYKATSGSKISIEVSTSVKEVLEETDRKIRSQGRQDRRYLDREDFIRRLDRRSYEVSTRNGSRRPCDEKGKLQAASRGHQRTPRNAAPEAASTFRR